MAKRNITTDGAPTTAPIGRPKSTSVKDHWVSFRVTAEEQFQLLDKAERSGMTAGEYARSRVLRGIARAKKKPAPARDIFGRNSRALLHEVRKQGVNLNQIAHHCNRHQVPPPPSLEALIAELQAIWRKAIR